MKIPTDYAWIYAWLPFLPTLQVCRVQVFVKGVRDSKIFRTKREASAWGAARESEIRADNNKTKKEELYTLRDAFRKYSIEVSPRKKGHHWKVIRLESFCTILPADMKLGSVTTSLLAKWRDCRLQVVKPGTVLRDSSRFSTRLSARKCATLINWPANFRRPLP
jgi:hypothetical protein